MNDDLCDEIEKIFDELLVNQEYDKNIKSIL